MTAETASVSTNHTVEDDRILLLDDEEFIHAMVVEVLQPGTHCIINGDVEGLVLEVSVGAELAVQYKVAWWSSGDRKTGWLDSCEVAAEQDSDHIGLGFRGVGR